jgi:hypothetical protein
MFFVKYHGGNFIFYWNFVFQENKITRMTIIGVSDLWIVSKFSLGRVSRLLPPAGNLV